LPLIRPKRPLIAVNSSLRRGSRNPVKGVVGGANQGPDRRGA
jgi:hypothetical protein